MKNFKPVFLMAIAMLTVVCTWSQKMYKSNSHLNVYSKNLRGELRPVERKLQQTFAYKNEVEVLDFSGTEVISPDNSYRQRVAPVLKKQNFFSVRNKTVLDSLLRQQPEALTLVMPFNSKKLVIDLVKTNITGDDFKVMSDKNRSGENVQLGAYYKGVIRGENSVVSISCFKSHIEGWISISGKPVIEFGQMHGDSKSANGLNKSTDEMHVMYSEDDLLVKPNYTCSTPDPSAEYLQQLKTIPRMSLALSQQTASSLKCVTAFWETSYNVYQKFGSTQAVTDFITTLFNGFATVYANENIGMKLNGTYIWTNPDPYANDLYTFSEQRRNFGANLAMLISTTGGGGVAWVNTLCNSNDYYKHSFCGSVTDAGSPLPNYSWSINVTTHETGHNLGSPHTHACAWNGNNTPIDGCGPSAGYDEGCTGPVPSKGTIMSYCHLLRDVGIDFALGFGQQPGDLMRGNVNSCITLTCESGDGSNTGCQSLYDNSKNDTFSTSVNIPFNTDVKGLISTSTDNDYYNVAVSSAGTLAVSLSTLPKNYDVKLYNKSKKQVGVSKNAATADEYITYNVASYGTYYIKVYGRNGVSNDKSCYTLKANFTPVEQKCPGSYDSLANNDFAGAAQIPLEIDIKGLINTNTDNDYYKFTATGGTLTISLGTLPKDYDLKLYNGSKSLLVTAQNSGTNQETIYATLSSGGTYYLRVYGYNGEYSATSCYTLKISKSAAAPSTASASNVSSIKVYPNPVQHTLYVDISNPKSQGTLYLHDKYGNAVLSQKVGAGVARLNVKNLTMGIYYLTIKDVQGEIIEAQKIVKQ